MIKLITLITTLLLIGLVQSECPDKGDQLLKAFDEAYQEFKKTTCQKCDGKVGETEAQLKWIENILFTTILSKEILGVLVDVSYIRGIRLN